MLRHQVKHAGVETALPHEDLAQISPGECLDNSLPVLGEVGEVGVRGSHLVAVTLLI